MAWIREIKEDESKGKLKEFYDQIKQGLGKIPNLIKAYSLKPDILEKQIDFYKTTMFGESGLSRFQREMIATVVSSINRCKYCVSHHGSALNFYWEDQGKLDQLIKDYSKLDLPEEDRAMLDYAVKLTRDPASARENDIHKLREAGFSDDEILDIAVITGLFNSVNRVVEGLGVDLSGEEVETMKTKEIEKT